MGTDAVPPPMALLQAEPHRPHPLFEQGVLLDEIDYVEPGCLGGLVAEGKIEPVVVTLGISVVLQDEVVLLHLALQTQEGIVEVATLESGVKLGGMCIMRC